MVARLLGRDLHRDARRVSLLRPVAVLAHVAERHREDQMTFRFTVAAAYYAKIATALVPLVSAVPR